MSGLAQSEEPWKLPCDSPSPSSISRSATSRSNARAHRRADRARRATSTAPTWCCSRNSRSAAIRRKTCCCGRPSSPTAQHALHAHRRRRCAASSRWSAGRRRPVPVVYNAASVLRDGAIEHDLPQARTAQLRGVRRAPLFRRRSGRRRLRVRGRGRAGRPGDLRGPVVRRAARRDRARRRAAGAGAERLAVRARQARAARRAAGAARDAKPAWRSPTSTWSAARTSWCSTARRCSPTAMAACIRPRAPFDGPLAGRRFRRRRRAASRRCSGRSEDDESRDALAWRAIVRGTRDYCAQERLRQGLARPVRRHRFGAGAGAGRRRAGRGQRHRACACRRATPPDLSNDLADEQCARAGRAAAHGADRGAVRGLPGRAGAGVRRPRRPTSPRRTCSRAAAARC